MLDGTAPGDADRMRAAVERLLKPDRRAHDRATDELAAVGDRRVVPHLTEVATLHAVGTRWSEFGFPEVLRASHPPRSLSVPEARWPGAVEALCAVAPPDWDSPAAFLRWESWYTREGVDPLAGFGDWKRRLYERYHPLVGRLLDAEGLDPATVRWGNTDPAALHPLNGPEFRPGDDADHLDDDTAVFGFLLDGRAYAVPQYLLFPHELLNATLGGEDTGTGGAGVADATGGTGGADGTVGTVGTGEDARGGAEEAPGARGAGRPVALTYCTMCDSPVLYDRRVGDRTLTFGSTGCLRDGNKLMYDEETRTLWAQHAGRPVAGPLSAAGGGRGHDDADVRDGHDAGDPGESAPTLSALPVTRTDWGDWVADNPRTLVLAPGTGYDYDYDRYRDYDGFVARHYWSNPDVAHPGVAPADDAPGGVTDRTAVYGVTVGGDTRAVPVAAVRAVGPVVASVGGRELLFVDRGGDVAAYGAPPRPVRAVSRGGDSADGDSGADDSRGGDPADDDSGADDSRGGDPADDDSGDGEGVDAGGGPAVVDGEGRRWRPREDGLHPAGPGDRGLDPSAAADPDPRPRVAGRHGLWVAFRAGEGDARLLLPEDWDGTDGGDA